MSVTARRMGAVLLSLMATIVAGGAIAWACSPNANISLSPQSGPPGSEVTVSGSQFTSKGSGAAVEIRWNQLNGEVLATTTGPTFSVSVTIPEDAAGTSRIFAIGRAPDGDMVGSDVAEVQVTAPVSQEPAPVGGGGGGPPAPVTDPARPQGGNAPGGSPPSSQRAPAPSSDRGRSTPQSRRETGVTSPGASAPAQRPSTRSASPADVFGGSSPSPVTNEGAAQLGSGVGAEAPASGGPARARASELSASGDLWSGFTNGGAQSFGNGGGDALGGGATMNHALVGSALLGLGLVALMVAALFFEVGRRRRVPAQARRTPPHD